MAIVALAGQTVAEPLRQPYKLKLARMSVNTMFGLNRRQTEGYSPEQQFCGSGNTCAEACGTGFAQCDSNDGVVHCFNKTAKQTCCPGLTGDSCDKGYFCSADEKGATWCCPDSMTLKQCAAAYNLPGPLVTESAPATSTAKSPVSTRTATATANATSAKVVQSTTKVVAPETTAVPVETPAAASTTPDITTPEIPTSTSASASPTTTPPDNGIVQAGSDTIHAPMGVMVLIGAAAFAALL